MDKLKRIFACKTEDITPREPKRIRLGAKEVAVIFRTVMGYYAVENHCPHAGALLHEGHLEGQILVCIWHCWRFDLESGQCLNEYWARLKTYSVIIEEDNIYLEKLD